MWPYVSFGSGNTSDDGQKRIIAFSLANAGNGPARIKEFSLKCGHQKVASGLAHRTAGTSQDFGALRLSGPSTPDTSFGSSGFALYDVGSGINPNANYATSAVLTSRGLVIVGTAQDDTAGIDVALVRLAPFDGIFKNGFEGLSIF